MIKLELSIDLTNQSEVAEAYEVLNKLNGAAPTPAVESEPAKPAEVKKPKAQAKPDVKEPDVKEPEVKETETQSDPSVSMDDIRALMSPEFIQENRPAIKQKLVNLGAAKLPLLPEDKYGEFYEFVKGLQ